MTQDEIVARHKKLRDDIAKAQGKVKIAQAKLRVLEEMCSHPAMYSYTAMGDPGRRCPDCGYDV